MGKKVIIDCDPGVDDALALILAFHSPELEVIGISGVNGNVCLDRVMANIAKIIGLIRPESYPLIARGADCPLEGECCFAEHIHGEEGLGEARLDTPAGEEWEKIIPGSAAEFMCRTASANPGEVTLIAIGPLTNLALAVRHDIEAMRQLKEIVVMGGALREPGNITPNAEFNFFVDPLAAQIVLNSGIPVTLVPLDVTRRVALRAKEMEIVARIPEPFARFLTESTGYDAEKRRFRGEREAFYLHDPLAVGAVINPDLFTKSRIPVLVETHEGENYGRLVEADPSSVPGAQDVHVCLEIEGDKFLAMFLSRLAA